MGQAGDSKLQRQLAVGAIAEGGIGGLFTLAQPNLLFLRHREFLGAQPRALVVAVTGRLMGGEPAGAPPVVTSFKFHRNRLRCCDFG